MIIMIIIIFLLNPPHHHPQDQPRRDQGPRLGDDVRAEPASQGGGELPTHRGETDMWDSNKTLLL